MFAVADLESRAIQLFVKGCGAWRASHELIFKNRVTDWQQLEFATWPF
jgi:hypothetical protein